MPHAIELEHRRLSFGLEAVFCRLESASHTVSSTPHNVSPENAGSVPVPDLRHPSELLAPVAHEEMKSARSAVPHYPRGTAVQSCPHESVRDASPDRTL